MPVEHGEPRGERLQKVLAHAGVASRRKCEQYMLQGRVKVNGQVVRELGSRVRPGVDQIKFDDKLVVVQKECLYYLLYKPVGYVSTASDPHGRPVVVDLAPTKERLYPVGRLDMDSEGLLLLTNDGELAHRLMHPHYEHEKEYLVLVRGELGHDDITLLKRGVRLQGEKRPARADVSQMPSHWRWRNQKIPSGYHWIRVILHEGRKRQIRRMLGGINHPVERLVRVRTADLRLGSLRPGKGRWLEEQEVQALRRFVGLENKK